jgi:hypothetical protein
MQYKYLLWGKNIKKIRKSVNEIRKFFNVPRYAKVTRIYVVTCNEC